MLASLTFQTPLGLDLMWPELLVAASALAVILVEVLLPADRRSYATGFVAALGLAAAALFVAVAGKEGRALVVLGEAGTPWEDVLLTGWRSDAFSLFVRGLAAVGGLLVVLLSLPYTRRMDRGHGEFYGLLLIAILGVMLVSGVSDLLTLFICLELVTITSYVLAAFKRGDLKATEAGLKYLVVGAVSSAILLLGIALTYGAVGQVAFEAIADTIQEGTPGTMLVAGLVLVLVGILFKVGAFPFHVWIPDVYQGAPSPVVAFLSTGSKAAGMVLLLRLAGAIFVPWVEATWAQGDTLGLVWVWLLGGLAGLTVLFGLLGAVPQRSFKRLLGYSSIGHAGYLLMGVAAIAAVGWPTQTGDASGATAILFYLGAFFFTNLTAFTVLVLVSGATGGRHGAESYAGLSKRSPFLALAMLLALLSLAGVPPLAGFFGKFLILQAVVSAAQAKSLAGLWVLAFTGALGVAVSLYFYLKWIKEMYFEDPEPVVADEPIRLHPWAVVVLAVGIVAMLGLGIFMGPLHGLASEAARALASGF